MIDNVDRFWERFQLTNTLSLERRKLMEEMVFFVSKRMQCEEDYANSMLELGNLQIGDMS